MSDITPDIHGAQDLVADGKAERAIALLTQAIATDATNPQAFHERAMAHNELDQKAAAIADFDRALDLDPRFPGALEWRARAKEDLGDHRGAAEDRLRALRANPNGSPGMGVSPQDWADCARAFDNAGDRDRAVALLNEYFDEHQSRVTSYARYETAPMRMLAEWLLDVGEIDTARELAERAVASSHSCPADRMTLARVLEAAGELDEARRLVDELARFFDGRSEEVLEMRRRLSDR